MVFHTVGRPFLSGLVLVRIDKTHMLSRPLKARIKMVIFCLLEKGEGMRMEMQITARKEGQADTFGQALAIIINNLDMKPHHLRGYSKYKTLHAKQT